MKKSKIISLILAVVMIFSLCIVSVSADETIFAAPGTYTATAQGRNGDVIVTMTCDSVSIISIEAESQETEAIGGAAITALIEKVIAGQSVAVDAVSGATLSSNAFVQALNSCIEQAGGSIEALSNTIVDEAIEYNTEADVIVVGAGGAGLMAAITAANDGASVILIEKSSHIGGNSLCAANGINAFDSEIQLANETYIEAPTSEEQFTELQTNERSHANLVKAFIENSGEAINYLSDIGVDFTVEIREDGRNAVQNYYLLKSEADGTATMVSIINALGKSLENSSVCLYTNVEATELTQNESGVVCGLKAVTAAGEEIEFSAKAVVLCTGGFGQNQALVAEVSPRLQYATTDELAPTTGDGLRMAQELGAAVVDLDQIQTFPHVVPGYGMILPFNIPGGFGSNGTIYVNGDGERFAAEGFEIPDAILAQSSAYAIFGEENLNPTLEGLVNLGYAFEADSVEELAALLGINAEGLENTISKWNEAASADGKDVDFGRENITAITGKLVGYHFGVGAHYFMGGILINENTEVLDMNGQSISGLYAAGEVTGGFHGTQRIDGSGTGDSIVFGMIAGHTVAAAVK